MVVARYAIRIVPTAWATDDGDATGLCGSGKVGTVAQNVAIRQATVDCCVLEAHHWGITAGWCWFSDREFPFALVAPGNSQGGKVWVTSSAAGKFPANRSVCFRELNLVFHGSIQPSQMKRVARYAHIGICPPLFSSRFCLYRPREGLSRPRRSIVSSSQWTSLHREFPASGFELLDTNIEIEEETLVTYDPEKYYSVQQREVFNNRYQTIAKLGYGVTSTVWLGRDYM
jgi:hypothetical protein